MLAGLHEAVRAKEVVTDEEQEAEPLQAMAEAQEDCYAEEYQQWLLEMRQSRSRNGWRWVQSNARVKNSMQERMNAWPDYFPPKGK